MVLELLPSLAWLIVVSFSLGFALVRERSLIAFGFGLAAFAVISIIFNLAGIPLDWFLFLALALAALGYFIYKKELALSLPEKPDLNLLLVLSFAAINFLIYLAGSHAYPYLEDDDPWVHAVGAKWVSETGSYSRHFDPENFYRLYIEPYPPAFDVLLGVLHQMTASVTDTMKFYNSLLIGAALVFAYFFFSEATKNPRLSMLAAFFLLALPSFMGHFIWAQTLAVLLMFVALYGFERSLKDARFILPSGIAAGAIALSQPSTAAIFVPLAAIYAAVRYYSEGRAILKPLVFAGLIGIFVAAIYYVPVFLKYGTSYALLGIGIIENLFSGKIEDTSGGVVYSVADYLLVQPTGKIDQHIGIGLALGALSMLGLALAVKERKDWKASPWLLLSCAWLVFTLLGTEGNALPFKLFPHRFWVFLSVPVAMLSAYAYLALEERFKAHKTALLIVMVIAVVITAADPKMKVQTSAWPPGVSFTSMEELSGYLAMKDGLPPNTKVFPLCSDDQKVIGSDMLSEPFDPEYEAFKRQAMNRSASEVHAFLAPRGYAFLVIDSTCVAKVGPERTAQIAAMYEAAPFEPVYFNGGFALLQLK